MTREPTVVLVSCSAEKLETAAPARDLYSSALFAGSRGFAEKFGDDWFILSGKHGLVNPSDTIVPYDVSLKDYRLPERTAWAAEVVRQLVARAGPPRRIELLAGNTYSEVLSPFLREQGYIVDEPLKGLSLGKRLQWLNLVARSDARVREISTLYGLLQQLERAGQGKSFGTVIGGRSLPARGVYIITDPNERRRLDSKYARIVRIGTHGVSEGSSSTLWQRLRTHRGSDDFSGNHRASIFRLHVGTALLSRMKTVMKTWGVGTYPAQAVRYNESQLEREVSNYVRNLGVFFIPVLDAPGPVSDRVYLERNLIALLSNRRRPIDAPSGDWLGKYSPRPEIKESGLWNLNHVDEVHDPKFLDVFATFVEIATQQRPSTDKSLAPQGWYKEHARRSKLAASGQMELL